jgi:hypothetical protein
MHGVSLFPLSGQALFQTEAMSSHLPLTLCNADDPSARKSQPSPHGVNVVVYFLKAGCVRVVVKHPVIVCTGANRNWKLYNSVKHQCRNLLENFPSQLFDVAVAGSLASPDTIAVTIEQILVDKLPLLHSVGSDTGDLEDGRTVIVEGAQIVKATDVDLPFSVWALVSLLILLEGKVSCKPLFQCTGQDSDATLPAQALQVFGLPLCNARVEG